MKFTFTELPLGPYTTDLLAKQWPGVQLSRGVAEGRCTIEEIAGERVMAVTHQAGKVGPIEGGVSWRYYFAEPSDTYTAKYKVRVGADFDFVRGGKLPGLCGGASPGGGADPRKTGGFSARVMWRELGVLESYVYHLDRAADKHWGTDYLWLQSCNQGDIFDDWDNLHIQTPDRTYLIPDQWHTITQTVFLDDPGHSAGRIIAWFDGKKVLDTPIHLRQDAAFTIDSFRFTTFFGGNDQTWAPQKNEKVYFKDIALYAGL